SIILLFRLSNLLAYSFPRRCIHAITHLLILLALPQYNCCPVRMIIAWMLLARDIQIYSLNRMVHGFLALPKRKDAHATERKEQPQDAHDHPTGEEWLTENVATGIHWDGPEHEKRYGKNDGHSFGND